jgi:hypothetical protein
LKNLDELLDDKNDDLIGKTNWSVIEKEPPALAEAKMKKSLKRNVREFRPSKKQIVSDSVSSSSIS